MSQPIHHANEVSILPMAARVIVPVQLLLSIYLLLRGHNLPGGGFIGGLVLASAVVLRVMAKPDKAPRFDLNATAGVGLMVAMVSALLPVFIGQTFFTGLWGGQIWLPTVGKIKLGTPLLFDIGVFIVVAAVATKLLLILMSLSRERQN